MITCRKATELVSASQEDRISFANSISLWFHLKICKCCALFKTQLTLIRLVASKMRDEKPVELSREAKDRIIQMLH